jgi:hypothetical protein
VNDAVDARQERPHAHHGMTLTTPGASPSVDPHSATN